MTTWIKSCKKYKFCAYHKTHKNRKLNFHVANTKSEQHRRTTSKIVCINENLQRGQSPSCAAMKEIIRKYIDQHPGGLDKSMNNRG